MTKLVVIASLVAGAAVFVPQPVAAQECTDDYMTCLNDSHDKGGIFRTLADIECFAAYLGCVRSTL